AHARRLARAERDWAVRPETGERVPHTGRCATRARPLADGRGLRRSLAPVALDERLGELLRLVVDDLLRRGLHQVGARALERAGDAVVQRELREADRVDHDAGRVRRVPDLELQLQVQRYVAESRALHPDVAPLPVGQPRYVVGRADMDVALADVVVE